ncbi:MAG: hypothetical protein KF789_10710 [Bdellovibrionaceae bacterium]|nr:hypothetical protein [Pseudobdellovibrionaceae bacterium]
METSEVKKAPKQILKKSTSAAIRVSIETRKKLLAELAKVNKKQSGKRVKMDALLLKLMTKITAADVAELQEASLTGRDRMEQSYRAYCAKFGQITMDEFLARISEQAVKQIGSDDVAKS